MRQSADRNEKDAAREAGFKKISTTEKEGRAMVEGGRGGGWGTTTKGMMYVDSIFYEGVKNHNHHRI